MRFAKLTFILMAFFGIGLPAAAVEITISCGAVGKERELCASAGSAWAQETGNTVTLIDTPETTTVLRWARDPGAQRMWGRDLL